MEKLQLKGSVRDLKTSKPKSLRGQGLLPAVLYGHSLKNQVLQINLKDFEKVHKKAGEITIIELPTQDGKAHPVLIHEVQYHYLNSQPIHVDFYEVSMTEKLKARVTLEFFGESKAVKELGGVLVKVLNDVEVECLPNDLPHNIPVDISHLKTFQDVIHVRDLPVPAKVALLTSAEELVAKVQPPRDVEAELAAPVEENVAEVEGAAEEKPVEPAAEAAKPKPEEKQEKEKQ